MNYQEEAQRYEALEERWARDDEHTMRHGGYTGPSFDTRPPSTPCGLPNCKNYFPFQGPDDYDQMRTVGWRLVAYGLLCDFVDLETGWTVKDRHQMWVCPECVINVVPNRSDLEVRVS